MARLTSAVSDLELRGTGRAGCVAGALLGEGDPLQRFALGPRQAQHPADTAGQGARGLARPGRKSGDR